MWSAGVGRTPMDLELFGPLPVSGDFDRQRAMLSLDQIPDDPPAPGQKKPVEAVVLSDQAKRRFDRAKRLIVERKYTEAVGELEKVLRYDANNHEVHGVMALACLLSGSNSRAELSAKRALTIRPDDLICHYVLGRLNAKAKNINLALREYRMALKCRFQADQTTYRVLTRYYLAGLLYQEKYYTAAIEQFKAFQTAVCELGDKVLNDSELKSIVTINRGLVARQVAYAHGLLGQYRSAAEALQVACSESPEDWDLRIEYIRMLVRAHLISEAEQEAKRFVADTKGKPNAVELLLAVHRYTGRPRRGLSAIKEVVDQQPNNLDLSLLYTDALMSATDYSEAQQMLSELRGRFPNSSDVCWKLVKLQRVREDWRDWLVALSGELAARPWEYERATREVKQLDHAIAEVIADEVLGKTKDRRLYIPDKPIDNNVASTLDYLAGCLCDRLDRVTDARILFERSVQRRLGFLPATIGLAEMYVQRCCWNDAIMVIEAAYKVMENPTHRLERLLGQCYEGLDLTELAVTHFEKAVELNGSNANTLISFGRFYERRNMLRNAQLQYQAAIVADPKSVEAREALIRNLWAHRQSQSHIAGRVASELVDLQKLDPNGPATLRCAAMVKYLIPQNPNFSAYADTLRKLVNHYPDDLQSREDLAVTLFTLRQYETARVELAELLIRDRYNPSANFLMVQVLIKLLAYDQAYEQFQHMLQWYPNRQEWISSFGDFLLTVQDYDQAIEVWRRLLSYQGISDDVKRQAVVRTRLLQTYREAKRFDEARRILDEWLAETKPDNSSIIILLRTFMLLVEETAGNYEQYVKFCRQWLEADPGNIEIRRWLVTGLIGARRYDESILLTLKWLSENPEISVYIPWLIEALQSAKRHDEAVEIAQGHLSVAEKPQMRHDRMKILASVYLRAGQYDRAVTIHKKLFVERSKLGDRLSLDGDQYDLRVSMGQILLQAGYLAEAIVHINKTIQWLDERRSRAEQLRKQTKDQRYLTQLDVVVQKDLKRKADLLQTLSLAYQRQDRLDLAEERLREAYQLDPMDIRTNNDLGYTLADAGKNLDEAERMIRLAVGEDPRRSAYMDSLGWVMYKKGEFNEALTWLRRAANLEGGQDPIIYDHLGDVWCRLDKPDQAIKSWRRALTIHDEHTDEGITDLDEKLVIRVRDKIQQAERGGVPDVAPIAGEGER
ncbi:MAG: hypothetical protein JSV03_15370 [Planctomycetota bacterium]|nr:MAG: hypothetical protein JSV03_15370 [Planctomycetota bacterium]